MRGLWLGAVVGLIGCNVPDAGSQLGMPDGNSSNNDDDWTTEEPMSYFGRFGGSFDMGDDETNTDGVDAGEGEEFATITNSDGGVECDWRWSTDTLSSPALGDCVGCDVAWDVTCFDGHEAAGSCDGWIDTGSSTGPVEFYLAFEPSSVQGNVEYGTIYARHSLYDKWAPYSLGTRTGTLVEYSYGYQLY